MGTLAAKLLGNMLGGKGAIGGVHEVIPAGEGGIRVGLDF